MCCGYGSNGMGTNGFDCVMIPGAEKSVAPSTALAFNAFCGKSAGLVTVKGMTAKTICCKQINKEGFALYAKLTGDFVGSNCYQMGTCMRVFRGFLEQAEQVMQLVKT